MNSQSSVRRRAAVTLAISLCGLAVTQAPPALAEDGSAGPSANRSEQVVPMVQPSIVYEEVTFSGYVWAPFIGDDGDYLGDDEFQATFQCTGFVVNPDGYIATAGHCVDMADGKQAVVDAAVKYLVENFEDDDGSWSDEDIAYYSSRMSVDQWDGENVTTNKVARNVEVSWGTNVSGVASSTSVPARVVGAQKFENGDAALLKVNETGLNAIALNEDESPAINTDVVTVGFPGIVEAATDHDLVPTFNPGTISSTKTTDGGLYSLLQLSSGMAAGMSGGPTVDADGTVVGVNSSGFDGETINYAVPVAALAELMADKGVPAEVSEVTQTYRAGITAYFDGDKLVATESLAAVVEQQPGNELAATYLAKAKQLPEPPRPVSHEPRHSSLVPLGTGAALLLLVLVGAGVAVVRRRGRRPAVVGVPASPLPPPASGLAARVEAPLTVPLGGQASESREGAHAPMAPSMVAGQATMTEPRTRVGFTDLPAQVDAAGSRSCPGCGSGLPGSGAFCAMCGLRLTT